MDHQTSTGRSKANSDSRTAIHALVESWQREEGIFPPRLRRSPRIRVLYNRQTANERVRRCPRQ